MKIDNCIVKDLYEDRMLSIESNKVIKNYRKQDENKTKIKKVRKV